MRDTPTKARHFGKTSNFAPRVGLVWTPGRRADERARVLGHLPRHAAPVLQHALRQQPAVGRADHALESRPGALPILTRPTRAAIPSRLSIRDGRRRRSRTAGVYVNTPLDTGADLPAAVEPERAAAGRRVAGGGELSREQVDAPLESHRAESGGLRPGATTGNTNARRVLTLQNADQGKFYGTIGQLDDTGRASYNSLLRVRSSGG